MVRARGRGDRGSPVAALPLDPRMRIALRASLRPAAPRHRNRARPRSHPPGPMPAGARAARAPEPRMKRRASPAANEVTYRDLRAMAVCLGLAIAAHISALPVWLTAVVAASIAMRLILAALGLAAPSRPVKLGIAAAAITILFLQLRTFNGLSAGTTLLSLVAGLKF